MDKAKLLGFSPKSTSIDDESGGSEEGRQRYGRDREAKRLERRQAIQIDVVMQYDLRLPRSLGQDPSPLDELSIIRIDVYVEGCWAGKPQLYRLTG